MLDAIIVLMRDILGGATGGIMGGVIVPGTGLIGGLNAISDTNTQGNLSTVDPSALGQTINGLFLPFATIWGTIAGHLSDILVYLT